MKILKVGKAPKLRSVKYKCKYCGTTFLLNDIDIVEERHTHTSIDAFVDCPGCNESMNVNSRQFARADRYTKVMYARRKLNKSEVNNDNTQSNT